MTTMLILPPTPIVAVATSRGSGAENLLSPDPKEVWADAAVGSAATIDLDLGVARPIDTVFLGYVLPPAPASVWTVTGGLAGYADAMIKPAGPLRVPDVAWAHPESPLWSNPAMSHAFWHGDLVMARYLRLAVTQPNGSPALTAGVAMVGQAFVPSFDKEWGSGRRPIDTGTVTPLASGGFGISEGARKSYYGWTLGDLTQTEVDQMAAIAGYCGETRPVLVVENHDQTAGLRSRIHYGKFDQWRAYERRNRVQTKWEMGVEEWV